MVFAFLLLLQTIAPTQPPAAPLPGTAAAQASLRPVGARVEEVAEAGGRDGTDNIPVLVTYPADRGTRPWTFRDLLAATCADGGARSEGPCVERLRHELREVGPDPGARFDAALDRPLGATRDGRLAGGRHPTIVLEAGLTSDALSFVDLMTHLSARGYLCVSLPSRPYGPGQPLTFDLAGVDRKVRDLRRVVEGLASIPGADPDRVALAAWSIGGVSTTLAAMQMTGIKALVSLDSGMGYDYGPPLARQSPAFRLDRLGMPILHVTGGVPNRFPVPKEQGFFRSLAGPDVFLATIDGLNHSQFVSAWGPIRFHDDDTSDGRAFWSGHAVMLDTVAAFLDLTVKTPATRDAVRTAMASPLPGRLVERVSGR